MKRSLLVIFLLICVGNIKYANADFVSGLALGYVVGSSNSSTSCSQAPVQCQPPKAREAMTCQKEDGKPVCRIRQLPVPENVYECWHDGKKTLYHFVKVQ